MLSNLDMQPTGPRRRKPKRRGLHPIIKAILGIIAIVAAAAAVYAGYSFFSFNQMLKNMTDSTIAKNTDNTKPISAKPVTILLLGLDSRQQTGTLNTDVIMVATLNPLTKSATLVSIPRDTYLKPEGYSRGYKINAFYSIEYRDDKSDYNKQVKKIFGNYLGIPIDYMIVVDFNTFRDTIDALGGITVNVDKNMCYRDSWDGTNINLKKGIQHLDGKQGLDFVRYRKSNCGGDPSSDFERNQRQQQVLAQIVDKLKSVGGAAKIGSIFEAVGKNVKTDISTAQLRKFILSYVGITNDHIEYIPLVGEWRSPYTYINDDSLAKAKQSLQNRLHETKASDNKAAVPSS